MKTTYRWPTKLNKFDISDPVLKVLVAKHENEISWQVEVKDEDSLRTFVRDRMLPRLLERVAFPPEKNVKHCYISNRNVDLEAALTTDQELDHVEIDIVKLIKEEDGVEEATRALVEVVNTRKASGFKQWTDLIGEKCLDDPAFCILLLRPLFDMSGRGFRRSVVPPSMDVIDWLYRRIVQGRLLPNDNVARVYCYKLGAGAQRVPINGWQYVDSGSQNAPQLTAACRGSGWCVASMQWASDYLGNSCFYILRQDGRPVVALRAEPTGKTVIECQGRHNCSPASWFADIHVFLRTQKLVLAHRADEIHSTLARLGGLSAQSFEWWLERTKFWPFSIELAPPDIAPQLKKCATSEVTSYLGFPSFRSLAERADIVMEPKDWTQAIEIDPRRFSQCPTEYRDSEEGRGACIRGWIERIKDGEVMLAEITSVDDFVRQNPRFREALQHNYPDDLRKSVRHQPRTADERLNRFDLERLLPAVSDEPADLAVERAVNLLLNNESADFSNTVFQTIIQERGDFADIRESAWLEALKVHPPLWFALPDDLRYLKGFSLIEGDVTRVNLDAWVAKVKQRPWLLTQQSGVPKTIRFHRRILQAYREGWLPYLKQSPWRIWIKRGLHRRVYMSYGLLGDASVIDALTQGWRAYRDKVYLCWSKGSWRMRNMPVLQATVLRAVCNHREIRLNDEVLRVCLDVLSQQNYKAGKGSDNPFEAEIRRRLSEAGFNIQRINS